MIKTCWDILILIATIYVALVVPYNAAFHGQNKCEGSKATEFTESEVDPLALKQTQLVNGTSLEILDNTEDFLQDHLHRFDDDEDELGSGTLMTILTNGSVAAHAATILDGTISTPSSRQQDSSNLTDTENGTVMVDDIGSHPDDLVDLKGSIVLDIIVETVFIVGKNLDDQNGLFLCHKTPYNVLK